MATWIALLRGINVGGKNPLPMKSLGSVLEGLGCTDVRTFIQSGNVVFCRPRVSPASFGRQIAVSVKKEHGFEPRVLVLPAAKLEEIVAANPFPNAVSDPKSLHVFFLAKAPK